MRLRVRLSIGRENPAEPIDVFLQRRQRAYAEISAEFRGLEPVHDDQQLLFDGLNPDEYCAVVRRCKQIGADCTIAAFPLYCDEEIREARFLLWEIGGREMDTDDAARPLNRYRHSCETCGSPDFAAVPEPFVILRPNGIKGRIVLKAMNGVRLISRELWTELEGELTKYVRSGCVAYADTPNSATEDFVWIWPLEMIGPSTQREPRRTCSACRRPLEVRWETPRDPLLRNLLVVKHFGSTSAPVARFGNWFGSIRADGFPSVTWDIAMSGALADRLGKLRVRGLLPADQVVHREDDARLRVLVSHHDD